MDIHCGGPSLVNIERAHGASGTTGSTGTAINAILCSLLMISSSALTAGSAGSTIAPACADASTGTAAAIATGST